MPYFKVIINGHGIDFPFDGKTVIGFYTTRKVRAADLSSAEALAKERVLSDWRPEGPYAEDNRGSLPVLLIEQSFPVGWFAGVFGRKPSGYAFYLAE